MGKLCLPFSFCLTNYHTAKDLIQHSFFPVIVLEIRSTMLKISQSQNYSVSNKVLSRALEMNSLPNFLVLLAKRNLWACTTCRTSVSFSVQVNQHGSRALFPASHSTPSHYFFFWHRLKFQQFCVKSYLLFYPGFKFMYYSKNFTLLKVVAPDNTE